MDTISTFPPGIHPTYRSSVKNSARGLRVEIRLNCRLVAENTSICELAGTFSTASRLITKAFSLLRSRGIFPEARSSFSSENRSVTGLVQ